VEERVFEESTDVLDEDGKVSVALGARLLYMHFKQITHAHKGNGEGDHNSSSPEDHIFW
jgi:hypothetical protein